MPRWTEEDRERWWGEQERGEDRGSRRDWRDESPDDERAGEWHVGGWRAGEGGESHGGAREWEARDRGPSEQWRAGRDPGEWDRERQRDPNRDRGWRGGGGEGRGRWGERGWFGVGWRADEQRYGPGPGRGPTFGAGGMYGGAGGGYGGSSYGGSGLAGAYRGVLRGDRSRGVSGPWPGDERGRGGGERDFDERDSTFTRHLRRYGRGPKGYRRSDERIREEVSERIARSGIDAGEVEVKVENGEVTLTGTVDGREEKRFLEDLADDIFGVEEVHNQLRRRREPREPEPTSH